MEYTYIDLFAGCGGLSLGLLNAGWKGIFAVEKSKEAFSTLKFNLIDNKTHFDWPEWLPAKNHTIDTLLKKYNKNLHSLRGKVTLVAGGPPCQGFSSAGLRDGKDSRNNLVHSYVRFVKIVQPQIIFFENVKGFTYKFDDVNKRGKIYSDYVIKALDGLGYDVQCKIVNFAEYGIPQKRKRFILIGYKKGGNLNFFEAFENAKTGFLNSKGISSCNTIADAISDLLREHGETICPDSKRFKSGIYAKIESNYQKLMRKGYEHTGEVVDSHRFANHKAETIQRLEYIINNCTPSKNISKDISKQYKLMKQSITLLNPNDQSPTLTTLPDDYVHYCEPRILTVREYARIQSFPDWFKIQSKYTTGGKRRKIEVPRYSQIGNAIPPLFAEMCGLVFKQYT